jgi:hypothetical protein
MDGIPLGETKDVATGAGRTNWRGAADATATMRSA